MANKEEAVKWTKEQQQVISLRNRNILVSAAAGSGKTAVLVERIITMISDEEHPVDIDKLLVVTFTNAAAAEMSERIATALEKKVEEDPDNMYLRRQVTLVRNAHICTFHSFCQSVIRNHFHTIGIDPSFRIGDETELKLLKNEVMEDLFEQHYERYAQKKEEAETAGRTLSEEEQAFVYLVEAYSDNKTDQGLRDLVLQLYEFSMSAPWPERWLDNNKKAFRVETLEDLEEAVWMQLLLEYIFQIAQDCKDINQRCLAVCHQVDGPDMYESALLSDQEYLDSICGARKYTELAELLCDYKWSRLSTKKSDTVDPDKRKWVQDQRNQVKKQLEDIRKQFFFQSPDYMLEDMKAVCLSMETLLELTKEFKDAFQREKEERRLVDFNDLEHYTLAILLNEETGEPTQVADSYRREFAEILVDEYQDSNEVQETILRSICKKEPDAPNLFMVGDVKQSIYKFRMARPELFMEKYESYSLEDSLYQRIDLHKNFRSRGIVLDSVNEIFHIIMRKSLGKVEYDENAALYLGNTGFPEGERTADTTELLLFNLEGDKEPEDASEEEILASKVELEARMVAARIKELVDVEYGLQVVDKKTGALRSCGYGDIAILLRTMSGWSDTYLEVLKAAGIPVYTDTRTGYFTAYEIKTILQFLKVLDNPRQDIPLAAVLRSMLGGFNEEELAVMRIKYPDLELLDTLECYAGLQELQEYEAEKGIQKLTEEEILLSKKADTFLKKIEGFRERISYTPIHQLIEEIYSETGFYDYVSVMPNGAQRRDNLDMLVQKAVEMEGAKKNTLFHFNRYIEKLYKFEVDFGEAIGSETTEQAVHIMSIHKSKGLEFPVVIVGGMAKQFNNQDTRGKILLHLDAGIGPDVVDVQRRTKTPSLLKRVIAKQSTLENLGEELRVLYVALTRAKEKLIMAGVVEDEEQLEQWKMTEESMSYFTRSGARKYVDWVAPVVLSSETGRFCVKQYYMEDLVHEEVLEQVKATLKRSQLLSWDVTREYEVAFQKEIDRQCGFQYAFANEKEIKSKLSVSELKHLAMELLEEEQEGERLYSKEEEEAPLPAFMKKEETLTGAARGTVYHKVFEKISLGAIHGQEDVEAELERMLQKGFLSEDEKKVVKTKEIFTFTQSPVAARMALAEQNHRIWREQPFVIGLPASEVKKEWQSEELILVQGIIDAYFEEEDGLVLLDYKTDHIKKAEDLADRYREQLYYYAKALEQITGKPVKEKILYSVALGKEILVS